MSRLLRSLALPKSDSSLAARQGAATTVSDGSLVAFELPDLVNAEPMLRMDVTAVKQALVFAFASGESSGAFEELVSVAPVAESLWDPSSFANDVFLSDFVSGCMGVSIEGKAYAIDKTYLTRLISRPPADVAHTEFRQTIFAELMADSELLSALERLYVKLGHFRRLLGSSRMGQRIEIYRRRIDVLKLLKSIIHDMCQGFEKARSGLSRLHRLGLAMRECAAYRQLYELLDYEDHLSTVDLRVRVGSDGYIRGFEILRVRDNTENRFYNSPIGRLLARLLLLVRGYRFSQSELLARLVDEVFYAFDDFCVHFFMLIGDMEFYLAGLNFRDLSAKRGLKVCLPEFVARKPGGQRKIGNLFNPLLFAQGIRPVPCDITSNGSDAMVIVTGPNSGGKTRLLQALAFVQMLGQAGLFVPAESAELRVVPGMFVSLIEEVSAAQREGQLGMELLRIRRLFDRLRPGCLVIIDELCSGTNPSEGEEIFRLVIGLLAMLRPQAYITTHFLQFASRLEAECPVQDLAFLQVELDQQQQPTYAFVPGVARTSLAQRTAERLGVTREALLELIRKNASNHTSSTERDQQAEEQA